MRLFLVGVAILMLLVGLGGVVAAQSDGGAYVTGSMRCSDGERTVQVDDGVELDLFPGRCTATFSDPRLSGTHVYDTQEFCLMETQGQHCMAWGTSELTGPDGTWVGTFGWIQDPSRTMLPGWGVLEGTGAYEGWTFVWHNPDLWHLSSDLSVFSGLLYEGPPPPWGETLPLSPAS